MNEMRVLRASQVHVAMRLGARTYFLLCQIGFVSTGCVGYKMVPLSWSRLKYIKSSRVTSSKQKQPNTKTSTRNLRWTFQAFCRIEYTQLVEIARYVDSLFCCCCCLQRPESRVPKLNHCGWAESIHRATQTFFLSFSCFICTKTFVQNENEWNVIIHMLTTEWEEVTWKWAHTNQATEQNMTPNH